MVVVMCARAVSMCHALCLRIPSVAPQLLLPRPASVGFLIANEELFGCGFQKEKYRTYIGLRLPSFQCYILYQNALFTMTSICSCSSCARPAWSPVGSLQSKREQNIQYTPTNEQMHSYVHLSAGELLRQERESGSKDGQLIDEYIREGRIVPVAISLGLLQRAMKASGPFSRFLIDGFPRNSDNFQASSPSPILQLRSLHCAVDGTRPRTTPSGL